MSLLTNVPIEECFMEIEKTKFKSKKNYNKSLFNSWFPFIKFTFEIKSKKKTFFSRCPSYQKLSNKLDSDVFWKDIHIFLTTHVIISNSRRPVWTIWFIDFIVSQSTLRGLVWKREEHLKGNSWKQPVSKKLNT